MIIKVCGMREADNIREVAQLGADWIGMIFYPKSPRYVSTVPSGVGYRPNDVKGDLITDLPAKRVGVFVDSMAQDIITHAVLYHLDLIQLHGHETPTLIRNLRATLDPDIRPGIKFIKAISVSCADDLAQCSQYEGTVDYFLFDTKCTTMGGSGKQFDWSVLETYEGHTPFLLSGGIGPEDTERVRAFHHPQCIGIDLNSRFETEPGIKDIEKLKTFCLNLEEREKRREEKE